MESLSYLCENMKEKAPLPIDKTYDLIDRFKAGDKGAGRKLVEHNIKFIVVICTSYVRMYRQRYDDLIGFGILGMYHAAIKFDPSRGTVFLTYAKGWIIRFVANAVQKENHYDRVRKITYQFDSIDSAKVPIENQLFLSNEIDATDFLQSREIKKYIQELPEREKEIFELRFGLTGKMPMTLAAIGSVYSLTSEAIRLILRNRLRKMKCSKELRKLQ